MVSPFSYSSNPADGGILYLDGLTNEKEQRIQIIGFNDIFLSPEDIEILEDRPSLSEEKKKQKREAKQIAYGIAAQFNSRAEMNGRCKNKFMGVVLSFPDSEREMLENNPQMMDDIVQDWLEGMGFEDAQYFAVYHYETAQPHTHIYVNMVGPDLNVFNSFQTKYRSQKVNREIEKKYGLKPGIGNDKDYKVDREKTNSRNKTRLEIQDFLMVAMDRYVDTFKDLESEAKHCGIAFEIKTMTNGKKGIVFHKDGDYFTGGEIGRQFTYGNLAKALDINKKVRPMLADALAKFGIRPNYIENGGQYKYGIFLTKVYMKNGMYGLLKVGKNYYMSTAPIDKSFVDDKIWRGVNDQVFSYNELHEMAKAKATVRTPVLALVKETKSEPSSKTTASHVSETVPSFPASAVPAVGHTVRDNKSAAHNGDGLDEYEEVEEADGTKHKVKKKTRMLSI